MTKAKEKLTEMIIFIIFLAAIGLIIMVGYQNLPSVKCKEAAQLDFDMPDHTKCTANVNECQCEASQKETCVEYSYYNHSRICIHGEIKIYEPVTFEVI